MPTRHLWIRQLASAAALTAIVACSSAPSATPVSSTSTTTGSSTASTPAGTTGSTTTTGAGVAGTATAAAPVRITGAQLNPGDPTLTLQNMSGTSVDMTGWKLRVGSTAVSLPASSKVGPNDSVTIHVTTGTSSGKDVYLGSDAVTLVTALRPGVKVAIENPQGSVVSEFALPA